MKKLAPPAISPEKAITFGESIKTMGKSNLFSWSRLFDIK